MEDQYGISDLRQFISRAATVTQFPPFPVQQPPSLPPSSDLFSAHHNHRGLSLPITAAQHQQQHQQYEMVVMGRSMSDMLHHNNTHHHPGHFNSESTTTTATAAANHLGGFDGGDGGAARWPRQETLTLLEIRSRLDHKFKEANQKGPLWDEVARIMSEEHGYQRTGKKCREKFENLYKYYKKTKEGKAGRQDGKHYRFFRQLEALYGEHNSQHHHPMTSTSDTHHIAGNMVPHFHPTPENVVPSKLGVTDNHQLHRPTSVSLSNSSDYETSSSDNEGGGSIESDESKKKKRGKRSWKAKVKEFIDYQMRKIMEKQEAWLEKMMYTLDSRERERMEREEEWRKQEAGRMEREHKFWASERAWIEARDSALMTALEKLTNTREKEVASDIDHRNHHHHHHRSNEHHCRVGIHDNTHHQWLETEVTRLIQLRTSMESRFQQCGFSEEVLWEDIAAKMAYLGYDRSASVCKEKWDSLNKYFQEKDNNIIIRDDGNKKRKENYGEEHRIDNKFPTLNHERHGENKVIC
uniref:Myb-like domain-containing protein n=1 Tax=Chenopodium quinoa TaxID=63459 RepID=A0A803MQL0_CHEQI